VPVFVLHHATTVPTPSSPLYVYGYGSYGCCCEPSFTASILSLVDRGFVTATACVRGGADKGRNWFLNGRMFSKKNSFTDFIAAVELLHSSGMGCKATTIIHGASAGGMLVGAVATMRPDLQAACVMQVPFVDVLNTMSDETLPLTPMEWPEWGNPLVSEEAYDYIASYSPYDNVRDAAYPTTLILGGLTDSRVTYAPQRLPAVIFCNNLNRYWEPAKMTAAMRAHNTGPNNILLKARA
jgi:oligopeptidase B